MSKAIGFVAGLAVGVAAGAGGVLAVSGPAAGGAAGLAAVEPGMDWRAEAQRLTAELEQVRAQPPAPAGGGVQAGPGEAAAAPDAGESGTTTDDETAAPLGPAPAAQPLTPEQAAAEAARAKAKARKKAVKAFRKQLSAQMRDLREHPAGSDAVLARIEEWRELVKGDDAEFAKHASRALLYLARAGKIRPADAPALAEDFGSLPEGASGRPGLAGAVARAWAEDDRLGGWLNGLPSQAEPDVREMAIWSLDESPSDPYREWILRLARSEPDPEVVDSVYDEDIVAVTLTRQTASRWVAAVEPRIADGGLKPKIRARAYFALGLVGQQDPDGAKASLARMAAAEQDPAVQAFAKGVIALIEKDASNVQALEGLWDRHRPDFGRE